VDPIELHALFERRLGYFLLKREQESYQVNPLSLTLSHLMEKGRVVLLYKFPIMSGYMESTLCFWESRCIHTAAPLVMTLDPLVQEGYQLEHFTNFSSDYHQVAKKKHKCVFHIMYSLAPTLGQMVKSSPVGKIFVPAQSGSNLGSLQECAQTINPRLSKFVERIKRHVDSDQLKDIGMIISVDFVEESDLVDQVLSLNNWKFRNSQMLSS